MQGLPDDAVYKIVRGNAIRMLSLDVDLSRAARVTRSACRARARARSSR